MDENILELSIGVLARPVSTMRRICQRRPMGWGIIISVLVSLIGASLQVAQSEEAPSYLAEGVPAPAIDPVAWFIIAPMIALLGLALAAALFHFTAFLLGGRSTYAGVFSAIAFARLPSVFNAPLVLLSVLLGPAGSFLVGLGNMGLIVWSMALIVIGIRENYQLTTGRAILVFLLPLLAIVGLLLLIALAVAILVGAALAPR